MNKKDKYKVLEKELKELIKKTNKLRDESEELFQDCDDLMNDICNNFNDGVEITTTQEELVEFLEGIEQLVRMSYIIDYVFYPNDYDVIHDLAFSIIENNIDDIEDIYDLFDLFDINTFLYALYDSGKIEEDELEDSVHVKKRILH